MRHPNLFLLGRLGRVVVVVFITMFVFFLVFKTSVFRSVRDVAMVKSTPVFICGKNPSDSLHAENKLVFGTELSCYVTYYRSLTAFLGAPVALLDLKRRVVNDKYANEECHQIAHAIGRSAVENNLVVATAFAAGDPLCADGYFHGVMEGIIQKRGTKEISVEFLNGLCEPFRQNQSSGADHYNCAHGIGHGSHACPV